MNVNNDHTDVIDIKKAKAVETKDPNLDSEPEKDVGIARQEC